MSLTYGYDVKTNDDQMLEAPVEVNKILAQIVLPGAVLMNYLPFRAYIHPQSLPFSSFSLPILSTIRPFLDSFL
jgi:hypothetical protein